MAFVQSKYQELENDVIKLKESMDFLSKVVYIQQESIDSLEDFIEISKNDVKKGEKEIKRASNYSSYLSWLTAGAAAGIMGLMIFLKR
jgi:hypothetical protein